MPTFNDLGSRGSKATNKATPGKFCEAHGGHGRHSRRARRHLHDGGAHLEAFGLSQNPGRGRDRVRAIGFSCPKRVVAQTLGMLYGVHRNIEFTTRISG